MIIIAALQAPPLVRQKQWPELAGFGAMWLFASVYAVLIAAGVPIPTAPEVTGRLLEALYRLLGLESILSL
jgi:hypothetical protein